MAKRSCLLAATILATSACDDSIGPAAAPPLPTSLQSTVTNPFFPLPIGRTLAGLEVDSVTVLILAKIVNGFAATAVHDRLYLDGSLIEDTYDWFAQDGDGNV